MTLQLDAGTCINRVYMMQLHNKLSSLLRQRNVELALIFAWRFRDLALLLGNVIRLVILISCLYHSQTVGDRAASPRC